MERMKIVAGKCRRIRDEKGHRFRSVVLCDWQCRVAERRPRKGMGAELQVAAWMAGTAALGLGTGSALGTLSRDSLLLGDRNPD